MNKVNVVTLKGNLTHEPNVLKNNVVRLRIAVDGRNSTPDYFDMVCFKDIANQASSLNKGDLIAVEGCLRNNTYEKTLEDGTTQTQKRNDIIVNSIDVVFKRGNNQNATN